jgi:hypothetical protein
MLVRGLNAALDDRGNGSCALRSPTPCSLDKLVNLHSQPLNSATDIDVSDSLGEWHEENLWEGKLIGLAGSCNGLAFLVYSSLSLGLLITGSGISPDFPPPRHGPNRRFAVSGCMNGTNVILYLRFESSFLANTDFVCDGTIDKARTRIHGEFSLGCFSGGCCSGGKGDFQLWKV